MKINTNFMVFHEIKGKRHIYLDAFYFHGVKKLRKSFKLGRLNFSGKI